MTDDERAIRQLTIDWMIATKAGNLAALRDMMTDDVVFLVPGRSPFGKKEFLLAMAAMEAVTFEGHNTIEEIAINGEWAFMRSHIRVTVTSPAPAQPVARSGWALSILRKGQDGCWRIARDANLLAASA